MGLGTCTSCGGLRRELRRTRAGPRCEHCIGAQQRRKANYMRWHKWCSREGRAAGGGPA